MQKPEMIISRPARGRRRDEDPADAVAFVQQPPQAKPGTRREETAATAEARPGHRRVPACSRLWQASLRRADIGEQCLLLAILGVELPSICGQTGEQVDTESEVGEEYITVGHVRQALLRWYRTLPPHRRPQAVQIALNLVGAPTSHEVRLSQQIARNAGYL